MDSRSTLVATRRLIRERRLGAAERVLADFLRESGDAAAAAGTTASLRQLCSVGAEHLRLAEELDAAARRHRLAEQELRPSIEALLADWQVETKTRRAPGPGPTSEVRPRRFRWGRRRSVSSRPPSPSPDEHRLATHDPATDLAPSGPPPEGADPDADVSIRVLGPFDVAVAGRRITRWGSLKGRGLLQYLALRPERPVRREVLMELFWPGHSHGSSRNNLNVSLYSLRQALQQNDEVRRYILYREGCYLLNPELRWWIDRVEFLVALRDGWAAVRADRADKAVAAYERAVSLYRGPLFDDDGVGDWYLLEQRHLQETYLRALEQLGEIFLDLGELASAVQVAERALATDRCRESAHRLLMRCYARQSQQHLVSRQLQLCVTTLHEELGVAASTLTVRLFHELTGGRPPAAEPALRP